MEKILRFLFKASVVLIAITVIVPVVWYYMAFPAYSWNQKMTVEVETPDGVVTGSSVTSVEWSRSFFGVIWLDAPEWVSKVQGEAVVVDLGDDRYLFALLGGSNNDKYMTRLVMNVFLDMFGRSTVKGTYQRIQDLQEPLKVPQKLYPLLITFTNIADPRTVTQVDPQDLTASFGEGHSLKNITLEFTDDPVTQGQMEKVLPCPKLANKTCIPINENLPFGHLMHFIGNNNFWRNQ